MMEKKIVCPIVPEGTPIYKTMFRVTAGGYDVGMYSDKTYWSGCVNFGYFNLAEGHAVEVRVVPEFAFTSVKILPVMLGITPQVTNGCIKFTVSASPRQITLVFDDNYVSGNVLHLFVNPLTEAPETAENILYFPAGFHDLRGESGGLDVSEEMTVYLEAGAVLYGGIRAAGKNIHICGSGVIFVDGECSRIALDAVECENLEIDGVIVHTHAKNGWNVHLYLCQNVAVNNLKVVSTTYACTDGLDISNGRGVIVKNSFIRSCDDAISLKAFDRFLACEDIHFQYMILWNDCNSAMVVGEESKAAYYHYITFQDIDVLFSYDDPQYHEQLAERSVMSIVLLDGVECTDITWKNIRVNKCERLACFVFRDNFWFGTIKGDQAVPGKIDGVKLHDIRVFCDSGSRIANQILIEGFDAEKPVDNVDLRLVQIMGVEIDENYSRIVKNEFVGKVSVSRTL